MSSDILTIKGRSETGYGICIDSAESWIVAINNGGPDSDPSNIAFFGAHPNTDETFILVTGKACIATAPHDNPAGFSVIPMETGVCYNVRRRTWHSVMMLPGSKVAICENRDPVGDRHTLGTEDRARLVKEAMAILKG
ncbi:hypothetical protein LLG96_19515 [bacterium]|nr:hypothetical protein [bacterium]